MTTQQNHLDASRSAALGDAHVGHIPKVMSETVIIAIPVAGAGIALLAAFASGAFWRSDEHYNENVLDHRKRNDWRMPPLVELPPLQFSRGSFARMAALRFYLA